MQTMIPSLAQRYTLSYALRRLTIRQLAFSITVE